MSNNKDINVYRPGEYFNPETAKKLPGSPISVFDIFTLFATPPALMMIPFSLVAGDVMGAGVAGLVAAAIATVTNTEGRKDRLQYKVARLQNSRSEASLPKGIRKSLLPFGARLFPTEFRVESMRELAEESINRSFPRNHPINMAKTSYVVKTVKGKFQYADVSGSDPRESWDKLFKQETGEYLDAFRPGKGAAIYQKMANPTKMEIAAAKVKTNVDKALNKDTPAWIEEVAKHSF